MLPDWFMKPKSIFRTMLWLLGRNFPRKPVYLSAQIMTLCQVTRHHLFVLVAVLVMTAGFSCGDGNNDGLSIVKGHFVFYPEYSDGEWHEELCPSNDPSKCWYVRYTIPVKGCGPVTFSWTVYPSRNTFDYSGPKPSIDEGKYRLYAFDSPNALPPLGKPLPETCQYAHTDSIDRATPPRLIEKIYLEPVDRTLEPLSSDDGLTFEENIKVASLTNACNECFGDRMKELEDIAWNKAGFRYGKGNESGERVGWTPCGAGREDHLCCFFRLRMQLWNNSAANIVWLGDVTANTLDPITEHAKLISNLYDWKINPHKYRETSLLLKNSDTQVTIRSNTNGVNPKALRTIANQRIESAFGQLTALENPQVNAILSSAAGKNVADLTDDQLVKILRNLAEIKNFKVDAILRSEGIGVWDTRNGIKLVGVDD